MHEFMVGALQFLNGTPFGVYVALIGIWAGFLGAIGNVTPAFEGAALTVASHAAAYFLPDQAIAVQIVACVLLAFWHLAYLSLLGLFFWPRSSRPSYRGDCVSLVDLYLTVKAGPLARN
ncbi:hypothetical protein [Duganella vulcania]|uniref:Uncharacterized protein n=1 Tax=Duganella vulcania TaxID=2692166 RepID=A0A845GGP2_9BURK|nr:hypothetical protein [Duganella vulcania]MYM92680.1 hypothetical protein [Duganella vulcania]